MKRFITTFSLFSMAFMSFCVFAANSQLNIDKNANEKMAIFAMGCFWCSESEFRDAQTHRPLPGILSIKVGYAGGTQPNPTYQSHEGYKEAVKITYDSSKLSYDDLLTIFWKNIDPFDAKGQFCDKGFAYTSAIFYADSSQQAKAILSKETLQKKFPQQPVVTQIIKNTTFYDAEEYHQDYKSKNPVRYKYYRWNCGRDKRLKDILR